MDTESSQMFKTQLIRMLLNFSRLLIRPHGEGGRSKVRCGGCGNGGVPQPFHLPWSLAWRNLPTRRREDDKDKSCQSCGLPTCGQRREARYQGEAREAVARAWGSGVRRGGASVAPGMICDSTGGTGRPGSTRPLTKHLTTRPPRVQIPVLVEGFFF